MPVALFVPCTGRVQSGLILSVGKLVHDLVQLLLVRATAAYFPVKVVAFGLAAGAGYCNLSCDSSMHLER